MEFRLQEMENCELDKLEILIKRERKRRKEEICERYLTKFSSLLEEMNENDIHMYFGGECENELVTGFYLDGDGDLHIDY